MKHLFAGLTLIFLALLTLLAVLHPRVRASAAASGTGRTPVVVELFTSEGCSSCPPAEALLAKLDEVQPVGGAEVIALEEHVDYWDSLGWKDPFSSPDWTRRQQEYAVAFGNGGVYTPQMVVDGHREIVGSRERESAREIAEAARRSKTDMAVMADQRGSGGTQKFAVRVGKVIGGTKGDIVDVWLAVTESRLQSAVTRGENAGEHLHHNAVLRTLRRIGTADAGKEPSFAGDSNVQFDPAWKRENTRVVVLVQERRSKRMLGAATVEAGR